MQKQNRRALSTLNKISKRAGFKTLEEYLEDAKAKFTEEQRQQYEKMKGELEGKDDSVDIALIVGSGLLAIGIGAQFGGASSIKRTMTIDTHFGSCAGPLLIKLFSSTLAQMALVSIAQGVTLLITGERVYVTL